MKKFYYAMSNDAFVEVTDTEYAELENLIEQNASIIDEHDASVFETAERSPLFAANEKRIQQILRMTDEQFNNTILY